MISWSAGRSLSNIGKNITMEIGGSQPVPPTPTRVLCSLEKMTCPRGREAQWQTPILIEGCRVLLPDALWACFTEPLDLNGFSSLVGAGWPIASQLGPWCWGRDT